MTTPQVAPPSPPYAGPPARSSGSGNKPIDRVVIHATVSPCVEGQARATAAYFRSQAARGSAHYAIDPGEVIQCAYDSVVCWHAPPNPRSLGNEMCFVPTSNPVVAARFWGSKPARSMLRKTARLTARQCLSQGVPIEFLSPADLRAGRRGVTTHANVSEAWHQSTHWDPGIWPRRLFMSMVRRYARQIEKENAR